MQKIYIGADHRGYALKHELATSLQQEGHEVEDLGNTVLNAHDDYVEFAQKVARSVVADTQSLGIVICGSGIGVSVVANKVTSVRCALVTNLEQAHHARESDNCNVIALAADTTTAADAKEFVAQFIKTEYVVEERRERRLVQISVLEEQERTRNA